MQICVGLIIDNFYFIKVHKTIETHVTVTNGSPSKSPNKMNQLDCNFPRPPSQSGKRPPSRGHMRANSTSKNFKTLQ